MSVLQDPTFWITTSQICAILTLIICYLIGIPLLIYCLKTFYDHQHKAYFLKRNTKLFWVFSIILTIYILICGPLEALSNRGHLLNLHWYSPFATLMTQGIVASAVLLSNMGRFWYIFVQIRVSQERAEWKKILNPNYHSWVEKYYKYIANWKHIVILNIIIPLSLLIVIIIVLFRTKYDGETWAGRTLMGFITFCAFCQLLLFYLMQFVDFWYIRDEFRKYFYFFGVGIILIVLVSGSALIFGGTDNIGYFNYEFITLIACILFLLYLFYATKVIIIRNENRATKYKLKNKQRGMDRTALKSKFKQFVSKKGGYNELMQHITREFSTENLLFLTVLVHFQNFLIEFNYLSQHFELIRRDSFDIPDDVPMPPIIEVQTNKLRERILMDKKNMKSPQLQSLPQNMKTHIKRNSYSLKKEAMKEIFAFKSKSFKKLSEATSTPSHSFEDKPDNFKLSLTTTQSIEKQIKTDNMHINVEDGDDDMMIHSHNAIMNNNNSKSSTKAIHIHISTLTPSITAAMDVESPLPMDDDEDIFSNNLNFSALIPIYDMMYRRFIVRGSAPLEINISYACAKKLMFSHQKMMSSHRHGMNIKDWKELFLNLKDAGKQTLALLHDSYSRFKFQTNLIETFPNTTYLDSQ